MLQSAQENYEAKARQPLLATCYQKGFADASRKVWIKYSGKDPEPRNPNSVGTRRNFYLWKSNGRVSDNVEDFFNKKVETPFASFSQRVKEEQDKLRILSSTELVTLAKFVASQTVRTMAHKQCIDEQTGTSVNTDTFVRLMLKQTRALVSRWSDDPPIFDFVTPLPYIRETFITGDHPVLALIFNDNPLWTPPGPFQQGVTDIDQILSQNYVFSIALSPYVGLCIYGRGQRQVRLPPRTVEPCDVRRFNDLMRGQCKLFTLGKDRSSLK